MAVALELFVCVTGPSSPGLLMRMTMLMLLGATCVDVASAFAVCVVGALWLDDCACPPCDSFDAAEALGCCFCELLWCVSFELPAAAALVEPLCWVALPAEATFVADWFETAVDFAVCVVGALWTTVCEPPPDCVSVAVWLVVLLFEAVAVALEELV